LRLENHEDDNEEDEEEESVLMMSFGVQNNATKVLLFGQKRHFLVVISVFLDPNDFFKLQNVHLML
jgi:hypothetical protein